MIRRAIPYSLLPLALIACVLASSPWLRAFPSAVLSVPLFGAALLSVLAPLIVIGVGVRRLWLTALVDVVLFVFYELLVTLREPVGFSHLYSGLVHGPSQILTFALPLVSPRTLLVAPVALCWLSGAIVGECVARGWQSVVPYCTLLVTFGLAYAGTARAVTSSADGRRYDTILAGALLLALLLLRAAQAWVVQDESAETTQPDGILPLRGVGIGAVLALVVALAAAGAVQSSAFTGRPVTPARVPPLDQSEPLTPVSFVAGLRPADPRQRGDELFKVTVGATTSNYISLATVDYYDGDGWTFSRTFRPSGGVIPADADPTMHPTNSPVDQQYTIDRGQLTGAPWMPYVDRPQRVTGLAVNVDATSGMVVPGHTLHDGDSYTVSSVATTKSFDQLPRTALVGASASQTDTTLANGLSVPLGTLVTSLATETGVSSDQVIPFLQAVAQDFRTKSTLAGAPATTPSPTPSSPTPSTPGHSTPGHRASARPGPSAKHTATPTPTPTSMPPAPPHSGGTSFADVLASIRLSRSATPEQYATLMALVARKLGVPARVVTGFRIPPSSDTGALSPGTYDVRTSEAWTWVEIPVLGYGWVVLDPSPSSYAAQPAQPSGGAPPTATPSANPTGNAQLTHSNNQGHAVAPPSKVPHSAGVSATTVTLIVAIALIGLVTLLVLALLLRKWLRVRRRRRADDPRLRLLGAWQESLDVLQEAGLPDLSYLTGAEVAATTADRFGGEPGAQARYLGDAANVAIFSPATVVTPGEADAAWKAQAVLSRTVRRRLRWPDRIGSRLRYHRSRRTSQVAGPTSWTTEARQRVTGRRGR